MDTQSTIVGAVIGSILIGGTVIALNSNPAPDQAKTIMHRPDASTIVVERTCLPGGQATTTVSQLQSDLTELDKRLSADIKNGADQKRIDSWNSVRADLVSELSQATNTPIEGQ